MPCDGAQVSAEIPNPAQPPNPSGQGQAAEAWTEEARAAHRRQLENGDQATLGSEWKFEGSGSNQGSSGPQVGQPVGPKKREILKRVGLVGLLGAWIFFNFYKFDYVVILPGGTDIVNERITIKPSVGSINPPITAADSPNPPTYPAEGKLLWATVGVKNDVRGLDLLMGWLKGDSDVYKRELLYGKANRKEAAQQSRDEMDDAKSVAKVLAARRLGIATVQGGAEVLDREKGRPVEKLLSNGEVIVAADGKPICLSGDLRELMLTKKKGDSVTLSVLSKTSISAAGTKAGTTAGTAAGTAAPKEGQTSPPAARTVVVPLHEVKGIKRQLMGVILGPSKTSPCRLPFDLEVNTDKIGGPSAGLAMTLAVLDRLSPGELTGGGKVGATGTIEADGSVGEVGGVKQKTASVRASGAKLFIVPISEVALAKPHAGKMQVVGVRNLEEALAALRKAGGDPLPSPSR
jgi:Lon-like protease